MLDLIIPVSKNIPGLYRTLASIGTDFESDSLYVTIVDDASGDNYDEVISLYKKFFPIRVVSLPTNCGPGVARQTGFHCTKEPYVAFIDCGDVFSAPHMLQKMMNTVEVNPDCVFFSWAHGEENANGETSVVSSGHNRMHGKIYKRSFLEEYDIRFSAISPKANEDIGFNMNCRMCAASYSLAHSCNALFSSEEPAVIWKWSGPSIVRANDCAFYYKDQAMGLSVCGGEAIDNALAHNAPPRLVLSEVYSVMCSLYLFYLSTECRRPEFTKEAFDGCLYFYTKYFSKVAVHDANVMREVWYDTLLNEISDPEHPIRDQLIPFDLLGWLNELERASHS